MRRSIRSMIVTNLELLGADNQTLRKIKPPFYGDEGVPVEEISAIAERAGADPDLLATIGSWGDTLSPKKVLQFLKEWNEEAKVPAEWNSGGASLHVLDSLRQF